MIVSIRLAEKCTECPPLLRGFLGRLGVKQSNLGDGVKKEIDSLTTCYFEGLEFFPGAELLEQNEWILDAEESGPVALLIVNGRPVAATSHAERRGFRPSGHVDYRSDLGLAEVLHHVPDDVRHLGLFNWDWDSINDLRALSARTELRSLSLAYCDSIIGIFPLAALEKLESLDLSGLRRLEKVDYVVGKTPGVAKGCGLLRRLVLNGCEELRDIGPLKGCRHLEYLDLSSCRAITDIEPLRGLTALKSLNLFQCAAIADFSPLSNLTVLEDLSVSGHGGFNDLSVLSGLSRLKELDLSRARMWGTPPSPKHLDELAGLHELRVLEAKDWDSLTDIGATAGMHKLEVANFSGCSALTDIMPLAGLPELGVVCIEGCKSLENLEPLGTLPKLRSLSGFRSAGDADLSGCEALERLDVVCDLPWLSELNLKNCRALRDISPLARAKNLKSLSLEGCAGVSRLDPLGSLKGLTKLILSGAKRVKHLEPVRNTTNLVQLECDFHPAIVTEIIAHAACGRRDIPAIKKHGHEWFSEALSCEKESAAEFPDLVLTLCRTFSLLAESNLSKPLENLLDRHPEFTSEPWKAWFGGTLKESGFDLYRRRVERVPVGQMLAGAIGGACATLPIDTHSEWSRQWLADLVKARLADAKSLLSVAPEICLIYARAGEVGTLARWLERFTDPSDPGALDPVHAALGRFQIAGGDLTAAENHVHAIQSPATRDPILSELVMRLAESDDDLASASLLLIEDQALRLALAKKLAAKASASEVLTHRCVVAAGESPQALADLIAALPPSSRSQLVLQISEKLQTDRKSMLLKIAEELEGQVRLLRAKASSESDPA